MKKTKLNKVRKTTRSSIVRKLDKRVSEIIIARDRRCVVCHATNNLTNGHIFSRTAYSTRWEITEDGNCHTQCWGCNYKHEFDPYPFYNWYVNKFGQKQLDALHVRHRTVTKLTTKQLKMMLDALTQ